MFVADTCLASHPVGEPMRLILFRMAAAILFLEAVALFFVVHSLLGNYEAQLLADNVIGQGDFGFGRAVLAYSLAAVLAVGCFVAARVLWTDKTTGSVLADFLSLVVAWAVNLNTLALAVAAPDLGGQLFFGIAGTVVLAALAWRLLDGRKRPTEGLPE